MLRATSRSYLYFSKVHHTLGGQVEHEKSKYALLCRYRAMVVLSTMKILCYGSYKSNLTSIVWLSIAFYINVR